MSVKELRFAGDCDGIIIEWIDAIDRLEFTQPNGRVWNMDRGEAHLLMLYLQEHLATDRRRGAVA